MIRNPYDIYGSRADKKSLEEVYCSLNYSDVNPYESQAEYIPASLLSSMVTATRASPEDGGGIGTVGRQYIDPWDLENYAYLQRRGSETETGVYTSDCESTASSQFYYRRGAERQQQEYYDQYNSILADRSQFIDYSSPCDGSCRPVTNCEEYLYSPTEYRREPTLQFPPPPYDPYDLYESDTQSEVPESLLECQECSLSFDQPTSKLYGSATDLEEEIYGTRSLHTPHFSLSKKGLLQIDYSWNWLELLDFNRMRI